MVHVHGHPFLSFERDTCNYIPAATPPSHLHDAQMHAIYQDQVSALSKSLSINGCYCARFHRSLLLLKILSAEMSSAENSRKIVAAAPKRKVPAGSIPRGMNFLLGGAAG